MDKEEDCPCRKAGRRQERQQQGCPRYLNTRPRMWTVPFLKNGEGGI